MKRFPNKQGWGLDGAPLRVTCVFEPVFQRVCGVGLVPGYGGFRGVNLPTNYLPWDYWGVSSGEMAFRGGDEKGRCDGRSR